MCWVLCTGTKAEKMTRKKKNAGFVNSLGRGEKKGKKRRKKSLFQLFHFTGGRKHEWPSLIKPNILGCVNSCHLGAVWGRFLSVAFLSVVVTFDCLHDDVWITCKSVLCVNFIFPLCQDDPGRTCGSLCSLPVPPFLPICCGFHLFVLRVKGTEHFAQISTPPLENDAHCSG